MQFCNYEFTNSIVTKLVLQLQGGDGIAAIYVKQANQPDKIYYVHKDHLGSIVKLTDGNGTTVFKASYDVWGKQTVTNNTFAFHRGYTGHEHLNEFGLINMNGRMYDPNVGRFLSPDPFVQAPDFSQSFNRYSYCINNPLKYSDPSGELFGIDDLVFAMALGAIINTTMQGMAGNVNNTGDFWKSMGIGALSGAAGSSAGSLVSGIVGNIGIFGGGLTGLTGGFSGGFVSGAGNAWINGGNFGNGLKAGLNSGGYGALIGGVAGAISGGITAYQHGGNLLTGEGAILESVTEGLVDPTKPITVGKNMEYSNKYAREFSDEHFKNVKGVAKLYSDGSMLPGYRKVGDYVQNIKSNHYVDGITKYLGLGKGSNVYLYKIAFTSPERLYFTMGHEYIHAGFYNIGLYNSRKQEASAYYWTKMQSQQWGYSGYEDMAKMYAPYHDRNVYRLGKIGFQILRKEPTWYLLK